MLEQQLTPKMKWTDPSFILLLSKFVETTNCQPGGCLALIKKVYLSCNIMTLQEMPRGNNKWASSPNEVICDEVLETGKEMGPCS